MGRKIDKAFSKIQLEAKRHLTLSVTRGTDYDSGFANGFAEALRIVASVRDGE